MEEWNSMADTISQFLMFSHKLPTYKWKITNFISNSLH